MEGIEFVTINRFQAMLLIAAVVSLAPAIEAAWIWSNPSPQGNHLFGVWAAAPDDIFATGETGTIVRGNGVAWQIMNSRTRLHIYDVWGFDPDDVYAVVFNRSTLYGVVIHWDGSLWSEIPESRAHCLYDIWGSNRENIWAVGSNGSIVRYDGTVWSRMAGPPGSADFSSVWGIGPEDVYVVQGDWESGSYIYHWDGTAWMTQYGPLWDQGLASVWGRASDDVFVVGRNWEVDQPGVSLHYDGTAWTRLDVPEWLVSVTTAASGDVVAVGYQRDVGAAYKWEGTCWSPMDYEGMPLYDVCADGEDGLYAVGIAGTIMKWDGSRWTEHSYGTRAFMTSIWGCGPDDVYAAGTNSINHWNGCNWTEVLFTSGMSIDDIRGTDSHNVYASGYDWDMYTGFVMCWDGSDWTRMTLQPSQRRIKAVWASSPDDLWAASDHRWLYHWNGQVWEDISLGGLNYFTDVWGLGPDEVYVIGSGELEGGLVLRWDGSEWLDIYDLEDPSGLKKIWGTGSNDLFVSTAGERQIMHWDGTLWTPQLDPLEWTSAFTDIWGVTSDDVYVTTEASGVAHWDGTTWSHIMIPTQFMINGIWGSSADDFYITGQFGATLRWQESPPTFTPTSEPSPTSSPEPSPTSTPKPTDSPAPTPSFTPTAADCIETGVSLWMPAHTFRPGDQCACLVTVCNATADTLSGLPLFVILDLYGTFLYAPSFSESCDNYLECYPGFSCGVTNVMIVDVFQWPDGAGSAAGIFWHAALTNPEVTEIVGSWDSWSFSYSM